eukprot:9222400-Alexandrium_andersonii.AAC.1
MTSGWPWAEGPVQSLSHTMGGGSAGHTVGPTTWRAMEAGDRTVGRAYTSIHELVWQRQAVAVALA